MIRRIHGKVIEINDESIVVNVCGFGVEVFCTKRVLEDLKLDDEVSLLTTTVFGEEPRIYGFLDDKERRVFEKLMRVSKIGPKTALKMLSSSDLEMLISMIKSGDHASLSKLPGIGKKTAERIIVELKKEFEDFDVKEMVGFSDALEALIALGYSSSKAMKAIKSVARPGMSIEEIIKEALRVISKL